MDFYILYIVIPLITITGIIIAVRIYNINLQTRNERLEKIVSKRTEEIRETNQKLINRNKEIEEQNLVQKQLSEEIASQRDALEKAYQNVRLLGDIGKNIVANFSAEEITETVYENINNLMDADIFGIALFNEKNKALDFRNAKEKHETLPFFSYSLQEKGRLAINCFLNHKEIVISNYMEEYERYSISVPKVKAGDIANSIIYIPLSFADKKIGVITTQSFKTKAYNEYHLYMLRNIAVYASIALAHAETYREIEDKNLAIEKQSRDTQESIQYAQRIQQAILPTQTDIKAELQDSFVFFKPRDLVSGDFYWYANVLPQKQRLIKDKTSESNLVLNTKSLVLKNKVTNATIKNILAVVDCTGHGVPGAFMSMIGTDMLNNIVIEKGITNPSQILEELHQGVRNLLKQKDNMNRDGMDVAIVSIDKENKFIEFAGANRPLLYIQDGKVEEIKGEMLPIGGFQREIERKYYKHTISIEKSTSFYMFSDGYQDQFGGLANKKRKFMNNRFKNMLLEIQDRNMEEQKLFIGKVFENWKGEYFQLDDVLVIGFKL